MQKMRVFKYAYMRTCARPLRDSTFQEDDKIFDKIDELFMTKTNAYRKMHAARSSPRCREKREKIKNLITPKSFIAHLSLWSRLM